MYDSMPITKDEFARGRAEDALIVKIQNFLDSNNKQAFTEEEIMKHIYPEHIAWPGILLHLAVQCTFWLTQEKSH
jgi:hypothetical protein